MPVRAILNFISVHIKPGRDASAEDREKFEDWLYAPLEVED